MNPEAGRTLFCYIHWSVCYLSPLPLVLLISLFVSGFSISERSLETPPTTSLSRWQMYAFRYIMNIHFDFWIFWTQEFVHKVSSKDTVSVSWSPFDFAYQTPAVLVPPLLWYQEYALRSWNSGGRKEIKSRYERVNQLVISHPILSAPTLE